MNDHSDWPIAWFGLGINRLSLARLKVFSHEGPLLGTGLSNEAGGANALVQALKLDPGFSAAANVLAFTPMPRERDGVRIDLDTLRQFAMPTPLTDKQYLTGIVELPAPPGAYGVSLVVTQADIACTSPRLVVDGP